MLANAVCYGQAPQFAVVEGNSFTDSSYYDIKKVGDNEFWVIGKHGIITQLDADGNSSKIDYPNPGIDLLNMAMMDENNYLLCGDFGYVSQYNKEEKSWNVRQLEGFEKYCFYSICRVDDQTAYMCGGKSKIAGEKKVVPFGFIVKTTDGGKTWTKVYKNTVNMIWSIKFDALNNSLMALMYTPVKSRMIQSKDGGLSWKKTTTKIKGLYHDFKLEREKVLLSGGKNSGFNSNGRVVDGEKELAYNNTGIFWDIDSNEDYTIATSTGGNLVFKSLSGEWHTAKGPLDRNLYEIAFIDKKSAFLVGSGQTILKIIFP